MSGRLLGQTLPSHRDLGPSSSNVTPLVPHPSTPDLFRQQTRLRRGRVVHDYSERDIGPEGHEGLECSVTATFRVRRETFLVSRYGRNHVPDRITFQNIYSSIISCLSTYLFTFFTILFFRVPLRTPSSLDYPEGLSWDGRIFPG